MKYFFKIIGLNRFHRTFYLSGREGFYVTVPPKRIVITVSFFSNPCSTYVH